MWVASSTGYSLNWIKKESKLGARVPLRLPDCQGHVTSCLKRPLLRFPLWWAAPSNCELERALPCLCCFCRAFCYHKGRRNQYKIYAEVNIYIRNQIDFRICPVLGLSPCWLMFPVRPSHHIVPPCRRGHMALLWSSQALSHSILKCR